MQGKKPCFSRKMSKGFKELRARTDWGGFGAWRAPKSPAEGRDGTNCPLALPSRGRVAANQLFSSCFGAGTLNLVDFGG